MEIILMQDVKALGKKGDVVNVNDGYARNYILPKKLGVEANNKNVNDLKLKKANEEKRLQEILEEAKTLAANIATKEIHLKIKAGEGGRTFGSISTKEIASAVIEQLGLELDKKKMQLAEPIKTVGTHMISIKLHKDVTAELKVKVDSQ